MAQVFFVAIERMDQAERFAVEQEAGLALWEHELECDVIVGVTGYR